MTASIGYIKKNKTIKSVIVEHSTDIDELGSNLVEYFNEFSEVKELVKTSIVEIDEDVPDFDSDETEDFIFSEYENKEDYLNETNPDGYTYLHDGDKWLVSKPNQYEFNEVETILEEEY